MDSIYSGVQEEVVDTLSSQLTDSGGDQHMNVVPIHTEDEFEIAEYVADHERRVGRIPHAFVFVGSSQFDSRDSSNRMPSITVPVRVFVAVRNNSINDQHAQYKLASKWSTYVATALIGTQVTVTGSAPAYLGQMNVNSIANTESSALWEVNLTLNLNIDADVILAELENE